jgi:hypothetical protein
VRESIEYVRMMDCSRRDGLDPILHGNSDQSRIRSVARYEVSSPA